MLLDGNVPSWTAWFLSFPVSLPCLPWAELGDLKAHERKRSDMHKVCEWGLEKPALLEDAPAPFSGAGSADL